MNGANLAHYRIEVANSNDTHGDVAGSTAGNSLFANVTTSEYCFFVVAFTDTGAQGASGSACTQ